MSLEAEPAQAASATRAEWAGFAMMCIGMFMAILDVQVVATSLPTIQNALAIQPDQMSWIQTAYLIAEVIAIPLTGYLTRMLTMRWLFVASVSIFTIASVGCALSNAFGLLIFWRVAQGLSGGTLIPSVFSAVFLLFPLNRQGVATTLAGVLAVLAPTVGPIVGGWITDALSWRWLFMINVAPGVISAALATILLPRLRVNWRAGRSLDASSLILMAIALAALEIALKEAPGRGWSSGLVLELLAIALAAGASFVRLSLGAKSPLVDLRNFADRNFASGCLLSFALGTSLFGSVYLMPLFLGLVRGHNAFGIGEIMLVTGVAQLVSAPIVSALERRIDVRLLSAAGFVLLALGLGLSAFQTPRTDFREMLAPQAIRGVAFMLCLLPPTSLALRYLPASRVPDASALFNLMRNLGGAIGIALIDTVVFGRAQMHGLALSKRLLAGDRSAAAFVGIPAGAFNAHLTTPPSPQIQALVRPLIERAAMTQAVNDAWAMLCAFALAALLCILLAKKPISRRK